MTHRARGPFRYVENVGPVELARDETLGRPGGYPETVRRAWVNVSTIEDAAITAQPRSIAYSEPPSASVPITA